MPRKSKKASVAAEVDTSNLIRRLVMLLAKLEWNSEHFCPVCKRKEERGHDVCELQELLILGGARSP